MSRSRPGLLLLLSSTILLSGCLSARHAILRVGPEGRAVSVPVSFTRGYPAYALPSLEALGASVAATSVGARVVLFGDTLSFEALSPSFHVGGESQQLSSAFYGEDGTLYAPLEFFERWLPNRYPELLEWRSGALGLTAAALAGGDAAAPPPGALPNDEAAARRGGSRVVILDPGHGGPDPGKIGPGGIREKDVVLAVARRLAAELERRGGYEVHLTRTGDTLIPLAERPRMANSWKGGRPAALFLSIHANSHAPSVRGYETFFLSEARTEDERRVAELENAAVRYEDGPSIEGLSDLSMIASTLRNDFYMRASNDLAEVIQRRLASFHPGPNRGVKQAGFRVLVGAFMPAVLVELAFISNQEEARLLASRAFQDSLVWALADSVEEFFAGHEHLWLAGEER